MQLTLRREMWIGPAPVADDGGEVIQYAVLGANSDAIIIRDLRKTGDGAQLVRNEVTGRWEVVYHAWQISRDHGHTWEKGDYETAEAALAALPGLLAN